MVKTIGVGFCVVKHFPWALFKKIQHISVMFLLILHDYNWFNLIFNIIKLYRISKYKMFLSNTWFKKILLKSMYFSTSKFYLNSKLKMYLSKKNTQVHYHKYKVLNTVHLWVRWLLNMKVWNLLINTSYEKNSIYNMYQIQDFSGK